jgi:hypothetical protein
MSDTLGSLLGSAGTNPKIKKKGSKYVVEGVGEFNSYEEAAKALIPDPLKGEGPMMTSGESALDYGDEHQPGAKTPNSQATPVVPEGQQKPQWVLDSEKRSGVEYEYDAAKKQWRPKKGVPRNANQVQGAATVPARDGS